jgi:predicted DNA-binding transcriptional regulator AlpA
MPNSASDPNGQNDSGQLSLAEIVSAKYLGLQHSPLLPPTFYLDALVSIGAPAVNNNSIRKVGFDVVSFADATAHTLGPFLTVQQVAALLQCSVSSLNKWRVFGGGPRFVRVGSRVRYRPSDIAAFVAEQTRSSTSEGVR